MSKSKGKRDYEQEIEDAEKRMRKYKEHLKAARNSQDYIDFLIQVAGVNPDSLESKKGSDFWEKVRLKTLEVNRPSGGIYKPPKKPVVIPVYSERELIMARAEISTNTIYRNVRGRFTSHKTANPVPVYRDIETKQFISYKDIPKRIIGEK